MPSGATQSTLHKALVKDVAKYVKERGGFTYKVFGGAFGAAGMPDYLCGLASAESRQYIDGSIANGLYAFLVAIECKTGAAILNPAQVKKRAEMERCGVLYLVVHSVEELERALLDAGVLSAPTLAERMFG